MVRGGVREVCEGSSSFIGRDAAALEEGDPFSVIANSAVVASFVADERVATERKRVTTTLELRTDVTPSTTVVSLSTDISVLLPSPLFPTPSLASSELPASFLPPSATATPTMSRTSATIPSVQSVRFLFHVLVR